MIYPLVLGFKQMTRDKMMKRQKSKRLMKCFTKQDILEQVAF